MKNSTLLALCAGLLSLLGTWVVGGEATRAAATGGQGESPTFDERLKSLLERDAESQTDERLREVLEFYRSGSAAVKSIGQQAEVQPLHEWIPWNDLPMLANFAEISGTGVVGERRFEVSDHLVLRTIRLDDGPLAKSVQSRTQSRLRPFEALPYAVGSTVADVALQLTQRLEFVAVVGDTLEKLPEVFCSQAQPSDFVGRPDAKRPAAPILARFAIVAEDSPRPR